MRTHAKETDHPAKPADHQEKPADREHKQILEHLGVWEERSLLTHEQVDAIRAYESQERATPPRVPLITEVVAYIGAALALGAVVALVGPRWEEISHGQKLLGSALLAIALVGAGAFLREMTEPAVRRLAGVVWTLGLGSMTGFLALLLFDLAPGQDPAPWAVFVLGVAVGIVARVMQMLLPCIPLLLALFAGTATAAVGAGVWAVEAGWSWLDDLVWWPAIAVLVAAVPFLVAGARGMLTPRPAAMTIGAAGAVYAPMLAMESTGLATLLGVGVAAALLATSVWQRSGPLLVAGAIGLFGYLVGAIVYFLSDSVGVPIALLLSGVALLGVAVVIARLKRFTGPTDGKAEG
jgi:hypothetical protein